MSLRLVLIAWMLGCGGPQSMESSSDEPRTAKDKQLREAKSRGEVEKSPRRWGGWRYQGDREDCYYVVARSCFKKQAAACQAAHCSAPRKCVVDGAGPAIVSCRAPKEN
jgi:hypothetical protein